MQENWAAYLKKLEAAGHKRGQTKPWIPPINIGK
jgi:hypothetical protein